MDKLTNARTAQTPTISRLTDRPPLSYVVPVHNGTDDLGRTLMSLASRLLPNDEVIIVENGSAPESADCTRRLIDRGGWSFEPQLVECARGLGNALRAGVAATTADLVVCTAADLPFGFSDLDALMALDGSPALAVGSKAMTTDERPMKRRAASAAFRKVRNFLVPGLPADTQGTLLGSGPLLRALAARCQESGFLFSTEMLALAARLHVRVTELPVSMAVSPSTTVRLLHNGSEMAFALYRLRRRLEEPGFYPWVAMAREVGLAVTNPGCLAADAVDLQDRAFARA